METTRQNKIARLLQKELSEIFLQQAKSMQGVLVSVSAVRISPDMSIARAYLSIFPSDKAEAVMGVLQENARPLRGELGSKMGKQLRIVPEIAFYLDSSLDYVEHIEELLKK